MELIHNQLHITKQHFIDWLKTPEKLKEEHILPLLKLYEKHPYCSFLPLLLVKALKNVKSIYFEEKLPLLGLYFENHTFLQDFLDKQEAVEITLEKPAVKLLSYIEEDIDVEEGLKLLEKEYTKESIANSYFEHLEKTTDYVDKKSEQKEVSLGTNSDIKSFSSWLEELNKEIPVQKGINSTEKKVIQKFTELAKEKQKVSFFSPATMAKKSTEENEDLVTETLAEIFVKQHNYEKAIKAFEKLSLLFPEKKPYFASKIESLKKIKS